MENRETLENLVAELEATKRSQETEIKVFFSRIISKVRDRETQALAHSHSDFQHKIDSILIAKNTLAEQEEHISNLKSKLEQVAEELSPYTILSMLLLT